MKTSQTVLICLIAFTIFNYTAFTFGPLIQLDNTIGFQEKTVTGSSQKTRIPEEEPSLIGLGDPVYDPKPH